MEQFIRLPPDQDVSVTGRVTRVIDTSPMHRLASIAQLGVVALVYPGATHSRLEHSIGVYHHAVKLLGQIDPKRELTDRHRDAFLLTALVHDLGHWPFCHPIEDMRLAELPRHEARLRVWLETTDLAAAIESDWRCDVADVIRLIDAPEHEPDAAWRLLASCLSGPIDIDKMDYLSRDSLHAGVPYGRNFDVGRLIGSLTVHPVNDRLAVGEKGRTAAEMMVFARYVMFSEVYWHHAVRAATAMLQRAVFLLRHRIDLPTSLRMVDSDWVAMIRRMAAGTVAEPMTEGLFGPRRQLYKRLVTFDALDGDEVHRRFSRRPYWWLVAAAEALAEKLAAKYDVVVHAADVLIDAPPVKLEVDIDMDVVGRDGGVRTLGEVSPVVSALANHQFDSHVKRVRVFVREEVRREIAERSEVSDEAIAELMLHCEDELESELA